MARRFEFVEGSSAKFWEVSVQGSTLTVVFGKLGTIERQAPGAQRADSTRRAGERRATTRAWIL